VVLTATPGVRGGSSPVGVRGALSSAMLLAMLRALSFSLAMVVVVPSAGRAHAEPDCAACRAACRPGSYPEHMRPEPSTQTVFHHSATAEAAFLQAKVADPNFGGTNGRRAVVGYRRALGLDPENAQYRNYLAGALLAVGEHTEAVRVLEEATRLVPGEAKYLVNLGYAWHRGGDEQRALVWYLRALAIAPDDPRAHLFAGYAMGLLGLPEEAEREFRQVLRLDPQNDQARAALTKVGRAPAPSSTTAPAEGAAGEPPPLLTR
jgi:hypothetical protein